ncbi:MAG: cytidylate kinase family protein [Deltaproteobacteria bacterium]|jgi:hypothetical protein|nr:cytidylate kinase family protein [Deltaproteobacteria bacterium]MBW2532974.1 cytidylate kinase family protein [Deltaproteobacteria bacterium]
MRSIIVAADHADTANAVGKKAAKALGYRHIGPKWLDAVAEQYDVPVDKLVRALDHTASNRFVKKSRRLLLSYIETATLEVLSEGGVVCAGVGAHLYVRGVAHVLMVRVIEDRESQIQRWASANGVALAKAAKLLDKDRERRIRWSMDNFGCDETAPDAYDLAMRLAPTDLSKVVDVLVDMARYRKFKPTTYSRKLLADQLLASRVRSALLDKHPELRVRADGDTAIVHVKCAKRHKQKVAEEIKTTVRELADLRLVEVHAVQSRRDLEALD